MTIAYATLSILAAALSASLAWLALGPVWAALSYVGVGSAVFLGSALLVAIRHGATLPQPLTARRNSTVG